MGLEIYPNYEPESGTWSYLLVDSDSGAAAIIDPVWVFNPVSGCVSTESADALLKIVEKKKYTLEWVMETHAHADPLTAADYIRRKTGAKIAIGQ